MQSSVLQEAQTIQPVDHENITECQSAVQKNAFCSRGGTKGLVGPTQYTVNHPLTCHPFSCNPQCLKSPGQGFVTNNWGTDLLGYNLLGVFLNNYELLKLMGQF